MDKTVCPYCNKKLVTPFSCRRHIELTHSDQLSTPYNFYPRKRKMANNVYPPLDMDLIAMQKKACDLLEEGSDSDEEEEDGNDGVEGKEEDEEGEEEEEVDDHQPWMTLMEEALGKLKEDGSVEHAKDLLYEPGFSQLIDHLFDEYCKAMCTHYTLAATPIHKSMRNGILRNGDKGMGYQEAVGAAWDKRKHLIKSFVRDNMAEISEVWDEMETETE
jgi:hypothetical protein